MEAADSDQEHQRKQKLMELRSRGIVPYASRFDRTHTAVEATREFEARERENPSEAGFSVALAGRLVASRVMGKATFAHIQDVSGRIQLHVKIDRLGEHAYREFTQLDLGDIIGVHGRMFRTRRGEVTCEVESYVLLSKALRPLPEKYHGLRDVELRYRQRYLDLIANPEVREVFIVRSRLVQDIRTFLAQRGFLEVETPVLQTVAGGAAARPFITHHNALDMALFLRIALELHLKRLVVGGLERVFEIGHVFRNEGVDRIHSPEYTMLEVYQAYTDWEGILELTEALVAQLVQTIHQRSSFSYQGSVIDASRPFARLEMVDAVSQAVGEDVKQVDVRRLRAIAEARGIESKPGLEWGGLVNELFEELVQATLLQPTFVTGHPVEVSPLARRREADSRLTDRFELMVAGAELANGFSELNDPTDQRERFEEQRRAREAGAEETHPMDEDFLVALEHGLPPTGGMGLGIDRLAAFLTDQASIRDVILFPAVRVRHAQP